MGAGDELWLRAMVSCFHLTLLLTSDGELAAHNVPQGLLRPLLLQGQKGVNNSNPRCLTQTGPIHQHPSRELEYIVIAEGEFKR